MEQCIKTGSAELKGEKRFGVRCCEHAAHFVASGPERANELIRAAESLDLCPRQSMPGRTHSPTHDPLAFLNPQSAESHPPINEREMRTISGAPVLFLFIPNSEKEKSKCVWCAPPAWRWHPADAMKRCHFSLALCRR
jgi:hypothetical protein